MSKANYMAEKHMPDSQTIITELSTPVSEMLNINEISLKLLGGGNPK